MPPQRPNDKHTVRTTSLTLGLAVQNQKQAQLVWQGPVQGHIQPHAGLDVVYQVAPVSQLQAVPLRSDKDANQVAVVAAPVSLSDQQALPLQDDKDTHQVAAVAVPTVSFDYRQSLYKMMKMVTR